MPSPETLELAELDRRATRAALRQRGAFAWPTVVLALAVATAYFANLALVATGDMPVVLGFVLCAALTYMAYTPVHEAVHSNISGAHPGLRWVNEACGLLCAQIVWFPLTGHRLEHLQHHGHTNDPEHDPDFHIRGFADGPLAAVRCAVRVGSDQTTLFARQYWAKSSAGTRAAYLAELTVQIGWRVAAIYAMGLAVGLFVVIGGLVAGLSFLTYWFGYRVHHPYDDPARYRNTTALILPKEWTPLRWFLLGQDMHAVHHLFPHVPFYRYARLFREIEPILRAHGGRVVDARTREPIPASAETA